MHPPYTHHAAAKCHTAACSTKTLVSIFAHVPAGLLFYCTRRENFLMNFSCQLPRMRRTLFPARITELHSAYVHHQLDSSLESRMGALAHPSRVGRPTHTALFSYPHLTYAYELNLQAQIDYQITSDARDRSRIKPNSRCLSEAVAIESRLSCYTLSVCHETLRGTVCLLLTSDRDPNSEQKLHIYYIPQCVQNNSSECNLYYSNHTCMYIYI